MEQIIVLVEPSNCENIVTNKSKNDWFCPFQISNLLVTINSSVNFLVYCIFGNKFKQMFMQIFCGRKPRLQAVHRGLELRRSQMDTVSYRWED